MVAPHICLADGCPIMHLTPRHWHCWADSWPLAGHKIGCWVFVFSLPGTCRAARRQHSNTSTLDPRISMATVPLST